MLSAKRLLLSAALIVILLAMALGWGLPAWKRHVVARQDDQLYQRAVAQLSRGEPVAALASIDQRANRASTQPSPGDRWVILETAAAVQTRSLTRLSSLLQRAPKVVLGNEEACLLLARGFLHARDQQEFDKVYSGWATNSAQAPRWLVLEVDGLLLHGKADLAMARLLSTNYPGAADVPRLTRLATLVARTNLTAGWNLLADANRRDPRSPDVRLFRAQILESLGKHPLARVEYVAAHLTDPGNPWLVDQLAEFYRRRGNPAAAVDLWARSLATVPTDFIALKWAFWSRVAVAGTNQPSFTLPQSALADLANHVRHLPAGQFLDEGVLQMHPAAERLANARPEFFWLPLVENLRQHRAEPALDLLRRNRFRNTSWAPELEWALIRLLSFRQLKTLNPPDLFGLPAGLDLTNRHAFFAELEAIAQQQKLGDPLPQATTRFLESDEAIALAFVAAGWLNTGLAMVADPLNPGNLTPEQAYTWAQALRYARGGKAARAFLEGQTRSPILDLLRGELYLSEGDTANVEPWLAGLRNRVDPTGRRALWLLATLALERGDWEAARQLVAQSSEFAATITGRELLARIQFASGDRDAAAREYARIAADSPDSMEARAFLAREAFTQKDWPTARRLTEEMLALRPDEIQLRANLLAIDEAEAATR